MKYHCFVTYKNVILIWENSVLKLWGHDHTWGHLEIHWGQLKCLVIDQRIVQN